MDINDIPIRFVEEIDLQDQKKYPDRDGNGTYVDCPFCGGRKKLHIDYIKNKWRCNKCSDAASGSGQGGTIRLHAQVNHLSYADAKNDLEQRWESAGCEQEPVHVSSVQESEKKGTPGPASWRDAVYRALLHTLPLADRHREDLMRRGLTEKQIDQSLIRSAPFCDTNTIAEKALFESGIIHIDDPEQCIAKWRELFAVKGSMFPGFWQFRDGTIRVISAKGYMIPVIDCEGMISGIQIRHDPLNADATQGQLDRYHKYSWFSSSWKDKGCAVTGISEISYSGFRDFQQMPEGICLTEGCLKGYVTSQLTDWPVMALIGVSNYRQLPRELSTLKEKGVKRIHVMVDMDYHENEAVGNARNRIIQMITGAGIRALPEEWDPEYKGIDDWMKHVKREI